VDATSAALRSIRAVFWGDMRNYGGNRWKTKCWIKTDIDDTEEVR
jgi:hypothetical protein